MSFQYTSGNPDNLTGGGDASMVDIQGPLEDLEAFLNQRIAGIPSLVSSLPSSPVDGQEVYYLADPTNGVIWHLRYRAASGSTHKWEMVGGPPLFSNVATGESTTLTAYSDLATAGPSVALPLAGDYIVAIGATITAAPDVVARMSYAIGGTGASDLDALEMRTDATSRYFGSTREAKKAGLTAVTLTSKYRTSNGVSTTFFYRWMRVTPIRVG